MAGTTQDAPSPADSAAPADRRPARFATTRWSIVLRAGRAHDDATLAQEALGRLCRTYWFPLYAHVRRRGYSAHDAEDLTQGFFAHILSRQSISHADPQRGRFRSFILTALNHYLADEHARARAVKRGGKHDLLSLDLAEAERRFVAEADPAGAPDRAFDREWALALLRSVLTQLEADYQRSGKSDVFAALKPTLTAARDNQPYGEIATRLGVSENAVKVAAHRLRLRYRALLQAEIAETVDSTEDARAELHHLLAALAQ